MLSKTVQRIAGTGTQGYWRNKPGSLAYWLIINGLSLTTAGVWGSMGRGGRRVIVIFGATLEHLISFMEWKALHLSH